MNYDRTEQLIRDAFADEAARAADPREVLAAVRGRRPRRSYGLALATAAVVVVVAAVATFVIPKVFRESTPVASEQQHETTAPIPAQNVLVVGTDVNENTDSILLVRLDGAGATSVVSLPRDSWVSAGGTMTRLNQVYRTAGAEGLATAVGDLTGVHVDHWAAIDMTAVVDLTNAVGGVEVCLKSATTDHYAGADFKAGKQILAGDAALAFIRQRHSLPNSDLDRIVRLQVFLRSLLGRLEDKDLPTLLTTIQTHVKTDPNLDVLGVAAAVSDDNLRFGTIPIGNTDFQSPTGGAVIQVDPTQVKQFVTNLPSTPPTTGDTPCVN
jgi:LCP family protein required for cell wall assembly